MDKEFKDILDDCLERLLVRGETIEDCLAAYPQQADALKPLLQTTLAAKEAVTIKPSPEFRTRARYQFQVALRKTASRGSLPFWRLRWATVVSAILVILLAGGGLVAAAGTSMPDNPLYSLKLAAEQLRLSLTPSDMDKANLCAEFADRRVSEIIYMAQKGDASLIEVTVQRLDYQLSMITTFATSQGKRSRLLDEAGQSPPVDTITKTQPGAEPPATETKTQQATTAATMPAVSLPAPTAGIPANVTVTPPESTVDFFGSQQSRPEDEAMSELMRLLRDDANQNLEALYNLLDTASEPIRAAVLQAIAILEAGYTNAINAISE